MNHGDHRNDGDGDVQFRHLFGDVDIAAVGIVVDSSRIATDCVSQHMQYIHPRHPNHCTIGIWANAANNKHTGIVTCPS